MSELIVEFTGNVFADLGFEPGEAVILTSSRADERPTDAHRVQRPDPDRGRTAVGYRPVGVSDLVRGKWEKFSLEMLITLRLAMGAGDPGVRAERRSLAERGRRCHRRGRVRGRIRY